MTTIFDCETELGQCDPTILEQPEFDTSVDCRIFAQTTASLTPTRRILKIEQRCYLRSGQSLPDQPWIRPETFLEPAVHPETELVQMARQVHEQFVQKARTQIPENCLL